MLGNAITGAVNGSDAITSANQLEDYSYITKAEDINVLANCVSGLNNISNMNNSGWYFGGNKIDSQGCQGNDVAVLNSDRVGVYQL